VPKLPHCLLQPLIFSPVAILIPVYDSIYWNQERLENLLRKIYVWCVFIKITSLNRKQVGITMFTF
jgi:hypothetical protein